MNSTKDLFKQKLQELENHIVSSQRQLSRLKNAEGELFDIVNSTNSKELGDERKACGVVCKHNQEFVTDMCNWLEVCNIREAKQRINEVIESIIKVIPFVVCHDSPCTCGRSKIAAFLLRIIDDLGWEYYPEMLLKPHLQNREGGGCSDDVAEGVFNDEAEESPF